MSEKRWLVIGSDERMTSCARMVEQSYPDCLRYEHDQVTDGLLNLIRQGKPSHIILPVQGITGEFPPGAFRKGACLYTGLLKEGQREALEQDGLDVQNYLADERFVWNNARLTAEAFAAEFMSMTKEPVGQTEISIAGFGRVGRITAEVLGGLGAEVSIYARSDAQLGEAEALGFAAHPLDPERLPRSGYLVNTIPAAWLTRDHGSRLHVFELASMPGCLRADDTSAYYTLHLGLPGRHFPKQAGEYLAQTVLRMCRGKE
ncbi:hypothetical protein NCCP2716_03470 [Sporosarcina sp. NCCP-2716]|uniref:NAD(P)-dependent oxidoreductase n=1 Tax=Sporosarcina sp. NCCP-2716 TaxID=2943679 RepID=UPI002040A050|nr:NAD(P)-dependent oxidoreductase [Sporosarcina sp. NCCP-2716]GKV67849.1 hypothetical protein NCCP2716_03470 [Sporosarcina sp. NCCP-2716]